MSGTIKMSLDQYNAVVQAAYTEGYKQGIIDERAQREEREREISCSYDVGTGILKKEGQNAQL